LHTTGGLPAIYLFIYLFFISNHSQFGDDEPPPREDEVEREHAQWARQFSDTDEEQSTEKEEEEEEEEEGSSCA
jgi:hypothetical protein